MRFWVGPLEWVPAGLPHWRKPADALAWLDFRSLPQQAAPGPAPSGNAFFITANAVTLGAGYTLLGQAPTPGGVTLSAAQRAAWRNTFGLPAALSGPTLADALWDTLVLQADPIGQDRSPPLLPERNGVLRLSFGGLGREIRLRPADPEWLPIRERLRHVYRTIRQQAIAGQCRENQHRRLLSVWIEQFRLRNVDRAEFIPSDLPDEAPLPHETTITESFNTADSDTLGPDRTWTELVGDTDIVSNKAQTVTVVTECVARCDADLSSTDHYVQAVVGAFAEVAFDAPAVIGRKDGTATLTYYMAYSDFAVDTVSIYKCEAGTFTEIAGPTAMTLTAGTTYLLKLQCNGSTIKLYVDGVEKLSLTDTAITSGLRCGLRGASSTNSVTWDSFQAADLAVLSLLPRRNRAHDHLLVR